MVAGSLISVKLLHLLNTCFSIFVSFVHAERSKLPVKLEQWEKALLPISVMFAGSLSSPVKPLHLLNASNPIFVSFVQADKSKLPVKPEQP